MPGPVSAGRSAVTTAQRKLAAAFPRARSGSLRFLAAILGRLRPPAGSHHAVPGDGPPQHPPPVPPPRPARDDGGIPASMMTQMDIPPVRVRPYVPQQRGRHHGG